MYNKHIIVGIDSVINSENIKPGMSSQDLKNLEEIMINGGMMPKKTRDPSDIFEQELRDAAKQLGIDYGSPTPKISAEKPATTYPTEKYPTEDNVEEESAEADDVENEDEDEDNEECEEAAPEDNIFADENRPSFGSSAGKDLHTRTREQQRRAHIDNVMGNPIDNFSFENEKKEDLKYAMLAEIDILLSSLVDEDVDLSRIPKVNHTSDYAIVDSTLRMLRHKNDHTRYCGFAEEMLMFGAYGLEELFNGERTYFNKYRPDLTGWSANVNTKFRRMRVDTSQIVSSVMHDYNISPFVRILLELVPNCIMYSARQKQQYNQPSIYSNLDVSESTNNMKDL